MLQTLLLSAICALTGGGDLGLPRRLQDAPPPAPAPAPAEPAQEEGRRDDGDGLGLEIGSWVGVIGTSGDFESDPQFAVGLTVRIPLPFLDRFGVFAQGAYTKIDRDLDPEPDNADGSVFAGAIGADFDLIQAERLLLRVQAGIQAVIFDDIFEAEDGASALLGGVLGIGLTDTLWITANPQIWFGEGGDYLYVLGAGIMLRF